MSKNVAPKTVAIVQKIIDEAVVEWQKTAFLTIMNEIKMNLTGRVLKRDSGTLIQNVSAMSRIFNNVIEISVTVPYGEAWEKGWARKSYFIKPVKAKALAWGGSRPAPPRANKTLKPNQKFFSKGHLIPPRWFKARPFLEPAINSTSDEVLSQLQQQLQTTFDQRVPQWKITIDARII